jgi:hypothetical protein
VPISAVPGRSQDSPNELIIGHSQGSTLTSADLEATLAKVHDIVAGSCTFDTVTGRDETNKVRFRISTRESQILTGTVVVNANAIDEQLTAYSVIEVDEPEDPS